MIAVAWTESGHEHKRGGQKFWKLTRSTWLIVMISMARMSETPTEVPRAILSCGHQDFFVLKLVQ